MEFEGDKKIKVIKDARAEEEERLLRDIAERNSIGFLPERATSVMSMKALSRLEEQESKDAGLVIFRGAGRNIDVASRDYSNRNTDEMVKKLEGQGLTVNKYLASNKTIEKLLSFYSDISPSIITEVGLIDISEKENLNLFQKIENAEDVKRLWDNIIKGIETHKTSKLLQIMFTGAIKMRASDIHIEPFGNNVKLRYRIDSVLIEILDFNKNALELLISRLKILSKLKLNVKNIAQDGRFSIRTPESTIDVRVSTIPGPSGESTVMRLLDSSGANVNIENLGIHPEMLKEFRKQINRPNGMVITTGPTGSGKTTTLYSFMKEVLDPKIKIITIENPIEYKLEGITQTQVEKGYSFADGLRAALRQDPDIILVGEIRSIQEGEVAIHASLTGHIVFSTLHTNDAAGAIPRLIDMGIDPKIIPDSINLIIAQRLIRKLNTETKQVATLTDEEKEIIEEVFNSIPENIRQAETLDWGKIYEAPEEKVENYKGVTGVYEAILITEDIYETLTSGNSREIRRAAQTQGMLTLKQDAIFKLVKGITSFDEIKRVVDLYE